MWGIWQSVSLGPSIGPDKEQLGNEESFSRHSFFCLPCLAPLSLCIGCSSAQIAFLHPHFCYWLLGDLPKCYLLQAAFPASRLGYKALLWIPTAFVLFFVTALSQCAVIVNLSLSSLNHELLKNRSCIFSIFASPVLSIMFIVGVLWRWLKE